jgi:hypothetical protein
MILGSESIAAVEIAKQIIEEWPEARELLVRSLGDPQFSETKYYPWSPSVWLADEELLTILLRVLPAAPPEPRGVMAAQALAAFKNSRAVEVLETWATMVPLNGADGVWRSRELLHERGVRTYDRMLLERQVAKFMEVQIVGFDEVRILGSWDRELVRDVLKQSASCSSNASRRARAIWLLGQFLEREDRSFLSEVVANADDNLVDLVEYLLTTLP